jgi:hypothetical protein
MAQKTQTVSDIDGAENANIGAVPRHYPSLEGGDRIVDITQEQAEALMAKSVKDVITVELRLPSGSQNVLVSKKDLDAWLASGGNSDVLKNAAHLKGRRPGFSPNGN